MSTPSVVTDSTAYLPPELIKALDISVVSLYYSFEEGGARRENEVADVGAFFDRLTEPGSLSTTQPPVVEDFLIAYEPLLAGGGEVISIHISSGLSETCERARAAADALRDAGKGGERIHVVDGASTGGALGILALVAARAAARGESAAGILETVRQARLEAKTWYLLDTLEFLRRGGRIGGATAWIGATLNIKPILAVETEMRAVERVRSRERGVERLVELARQLQASGACAWCVQHARVPDEALAFAKRLQDVFWRPPEFVTEVGPVIGTHTGPGLLGVGGVPIRFLEDG